MSNTTGKNEILSLSYPQKFFESLSAPFVGREEEAKVITLAIISKEHVTLIGEPGTAKSGLARRTAELLNAKFFMYLLTKYTEPSELFGALDINALKQGVYKRITKDKLPESEIAFLDEIFNANSSILNTLLSILNERVYYDGYNVINVPLRTLISASNEIPDESDLRALYDRLLLRHFVKPVDQGFLKDLMKASWKYEFKKEKVDNIMSVKDLDTLYDLLQNVDISNVEEKAMKLILLFEDKGIHMTDRRKGKVMKMVASHSIFRGRLKASEEDLMVLKYIAPQDEDELEKVSAILTQEIKTVDRYLRELDEIRKNIREASKIIHDNDTNEKKLLDLAKTLSTTKEKVAEIGKESGDEKVEKLVTELVNEIEEMISTVSKRLGLK